MATIRSPPPRDALGMCLRAFASWFLRIECDRCGKVRMLNQVHATPGQSNLRLRDFIARTRPGGADGTGDRRRGRQQRPRAADRAGAG
jgi:hypothetical protein